MPRLSAETMWALADLKKHLRGLSLRLRRRLRRQRRKKKLRRASLASEERPALSRPLRALFIATTVIVVIVVALLLAVMGIISTPLPDITNAAIERQSSKPSSIFAIDGSLLTQWHGDEERLPLTRDDIPQMVFDATVAIEDQRFMDHSGLDARGILRALRRNTQAGEIQQGGSTITQQLMKMMYVGQEQSYWRKINEAIMATRVEMEYDKYDILTAYLNMAYFGQGAYGLASASQTFFGVEPKALTIAQTAALAAVLHSPSSYHPYDNPEPLKQRRDIVLREMLDQGYLSKQDYQNAKDTPIELSPRNAMSADTRYPYFVDYVQRELARCIEPERFAQGGMNIYTTLDPAIQDIAEKATADFNKDAKGPTASLITMRHSDGAILALIGGKNWEENQFNLAVQARRQPGSAFKPVTLIAALESGISPDKSFEATPYEVEVKDGIWNVTNYDGKTPAATMTLRDATIHSVNTVYARLIMEIGPQKVVDTAHALGFDTEMDPDPALALGGLKYGVSPLEMARAYTTMAKAGECVQPHCITLISDAADTSQILYQLPAEPELSRIYSKETGKEVRTILRQVITNGTGRAAQLPGDVAVFGKTGTTQSYRDAWFVGWAEGVTTAVWMGYPEAQIDMTDVRGRNVTGGSFPAEIWRSFVSEGIKARPGIGMPYRATQVLDAEGNVIHTDIPTLEEIGQAP